MNRLQAFDARMEKNSKEETEYPMCMYCMSFHRGVYDLEGLPSTYGLCRGCFAVRCTLFETIEIKERLSGLETMIFGIKTMIECAPNGPEFIHAKKRFNNNTK